MCVVGEGERQRQFVASATPVTSIASNGSSPGNNLKPNVQNVSYEDISQSFQCWGKSVFT